MKKKILMSFVALILMLTCAPVSALENSNQSRVTQLVEEEGINIEKELESMINDYESLKDETTDKEVINRINNSIEETTNTLEEYRAAKKQRVTYSAEIAAVIAYFNAKGYKLSSECLTHMKENKKKDSNYTPVYGSYVKSSSVFKKIANGSKTSGSSAFPNSGGTRDKDLYYAIHAFNYTKSSKSSKTVKIRDRYDFSYDKDHYSGLAGIAITAMYGAQVYGQLTPYYINISQTA